MLAHVITIASDGCGKSQSAPSQILSALSVCLPIKFTRNTHTNRLPPHPWAVIDFSVRARTTRATPKIPFALRRRMQMCSIPNNKEYCQQKSTFALVSIRFSTSTSACVFFVLFVCNTAGTRWGHTHTRAHTRILAHQSERKLQSLSYSMCPTVPPVRNMAVARTVCALRDDDDDYDDVSRGRLAELITQTRKTRCHTASEPTDQPTVVAVFLAV